jgi:AraC-like DNA-binding protein
MGNRLTSREAAPDPLEQLTGPAICDLGYGSQKHRSLQRTRGVSILPAVALPWFGHLLVSRRLRVALAQELLETSTMTVDAIAHRAGFSDTPTLRRHFLRRVGTTPSAYRAAFSATRPTYDRPTWSEERTAAQSAPEPAGTCHFQLPCSAPGEPCRHAGRRSPLPRPRMPAAPGRHGDGAPVFSAAAGPLYGRGKVGHQLT